LRCFPLGISCTGIAHGGVTEEIAEVARASAEHGKSTTQFRMDTALKSTGHYVWGKDHVAYGPMELADLAHWLRDGRLTADTWVFSGGDQRWRPAAEYPALQRHFAGAAPTGPGAAPAAQETHPLGLNLTSIRRMKFFAGLDDQQVESFVRYMEVVRYPQFSHIVRKGEHGDAMYLVLEGEVRALTIVDAKESMLATIAAGDAFGEISILDQGPRSADVIANKDSVLLKITAAAFQRLLREAPALAVPLLLGLSRSVVGRVRSLTKRYEDSVHFIRATTAPR
jgi:CRP-like cAMP-binding protein